MGEGLGACLQMYLNVFVVLLEISSSRRPSIPLNHGFGHVDWLWPRSQVLWVCGFSGDPGCGTLGCIFLRMALGFLPFSISGNLGVYLRLGLPSFLGCLFRPAPCPLWPISGLQEHLCVKGLAFGKSTFGPKCTSHISLSFCLSLSLFPSLPVLSSPCLRFHLI